MTDTSSTGSSVPVVPLRVAQSRSRIKNVLMWRNPKLSGMILAACMLFFYLTLFRRQSIVAVLGGLMTLYLIVGLMVVNVNNMVGNQLDKYIKRPAAEKPIFKKELVNYWAETLMDEGNEIGDVLRNVLYCDDTKLTVGWIFLSLAVYIIGKYFSMLPVFFVLTLAAFSLPFLYERNKKEVDGVIAKASAEASKHIETGRKLGVEKALKVKELAANKLEKAPPGVKNITKRLGLTPLKKAS